MGIAPGCQRARTARLIRVGGRPRPIAPPSRLWPRAGFAGVDLEVARDRPLASALEGPNTQDPFSQLGHGRERAARASDVDLSEARARNGVGGSRDPPGVERACCGDNRSEEVSRAAMAGGTGAERGRATNARRAAAGRAARARARARTPHVSRACSQSPANRATQPAAGSPGSNDDATARSRRQQRRRGGVVGRRGAGAASWAATGTSAARPRRSNRAHAALRN